MIFSIAMGADYSFWLIFNETCAPQFNGHNKSFLASVGKRIPKLAENQIVSDNKYISVMTAFKQKNFTKIVDSSTYHENTL